MAALIYKWSGVILLVLGVFFTYFSIMENNGIDVGMKGAIYILMTVAYVLQGYNFMFSSYRGNFLYWIMIVMYFLAGALSYYFVHINGVLSSAILFLLFAVSFAPSILIQMKMKKYPPPRDFFSEYFS